MGREVEEKGFSSYSLDVNDVIQFLQEVGVQVIVITSERVEVYYDILLHCNMVHDMDEVQESLRKTFIFSAEKSVTVPFCANRFPSNTNIIQTKSVKTS